MDTTPRALQHYLGHKNISHTVRHTELARAGSSPSGRTDGGSARRQQVRVVLHVCLQRLELIAPAAAVWLVRQDRTAAGEGSAAGCRHGGWRCPRCGGATGLGRLLPSRICPENGVATIRTKATLIYRRTRNLRAVQLLLGHTKLESTVRYLGIEVDDALEISEQTEA
jgi:hypothetical protein